jgi:hypothetical protein
MAIVQSRVLELCTSEDVGLVAYNTVAMGKVIIKMLLVQDTFGGNRGLSRLISPGYKERPPGEGWAFFTLADSGSDEPHRRRD